MKLFLIFLLVTHLLHSSVIKGGKTLVEKAAALGGAGVIITADSNELKIDNITLQLKWYNQFQFAGYYMAKEKGYYKEVDLNVTIKPYRKDVGSITNMVLNHENDISYGIGGSSLVLDILKNKDILLLKAILQESPVVILSLKKNTFNNSKNKRMMVNKIEADGIVFKTILNKNSSELKSTFEVINKAATVKDLIDDKTDFMIAYRTNEPYLLESAGYQEGVDYLIHSAEEKGTHFYSDILFTSQRELEKHPERVKKFVNASMQGWNYSFNNIKETVNFIYHNYNEHNKSKEALTFEAEKLYEIAIRKGISFGNISASTLKDIEYQYSIRGDKSNKYKEISNYNDYIYQPWYLKWKYKVLQNKLYIAGLMVLLIIVTLYWNFLLKKKVKIGIQKSLEESEKFKKQNKQLEKLKKQKLMEVSITSATHQLKSPLNSIAAIINNLKRDKEADTFNNKVLDTALEKIEKQSFSMRETVDYFLDLTDTTKIEALSVNAILLESIENFSTLFIKNEIKVILNIDEYQDFRCFGNKNQLSQVFHVIFDNAIEVLTERTDNRRLTVSIKENGDDFVDIVIADNGRGIPKGIIKRIFNFGFSSVKSTKNNKGVGLSIAKELIEDELDGQIIADNNDGAVFTIRLPLY